MFSKHWTPRGIVIKKHLFIKKTKVFSLLQLCILHINKIQGRKKHKGNLFAKISDNAAAYLRCKNRNFQGKKSFQDKWETRDQSQLTWSHRETAIYVYIDRPQKTRQGNDSIKALCNCISPLFQVLRPCATVFLPYSKFSPIYGIVGKWKENRKLFTFLNDAIDLRKHGIKNEIQQLKANCTLILRYLDHLTQLKNQLKNMDFITLTRL